MKTVLSLKKITAYVEKKSGSISDVEIDFPRGQDFDGFSFLLLRPAGIHGGRSPTKGPFSAR
jgi:hypothetical protein